MKLNDQTIEKFNQNLDRSERRQKISSDIRSKGVNSVASDPKVFEDIKQSKSVSNVNSWLDVVLELNNIEMNQSFSKSYLLFWMKLEQSMFFLNKISDLSELDPEEGLLSKYLKNPLKVFNGFPFIVDLVNKYGLVLKNEMPDVFHTNNTVDLDQILSRKLRQSAALIRRLRETRNEEAFEMGFEKCMNDIYALLSYVFGEPSKSERYFPKSIFKVILNAPVEVYKVDTRFEIESIINSRAIYSFMNISNKSMLHMVYDEIKKGCTIWASCDIDSIMRNGPCLLDDELIDLNETLATSCDLDKGKRIRYGESGRPGIVEIVGLDSDNNRLIINRNSQTFYMTENWFLEHVYLIILKDLVIKETNIQRLEHFSPIVELLNT